MNFSTAQTLIKDIHSGTSGSMPKTLASVKGNAVFFFADDGIHGLEPWVSDGTENGTFMLHDIDTVPYVGSFVNYGVCNYKDRIYFFAHNSTIGNQIWSTDGSVSGTKLLKNIEAGSVGGAFGSQIIEFKGFLYFCGYDKTAKWELFKSDGTDTGTKLFCDLSSGYYASYPQNFYSSIDKLYFTGFDSNYVVRWFVTDGTNSGTKRIVSNIGRFLKSNISPFGSKYDQKIFSYNNKTVILAAQIDSIAGYELCIIENDTGRLLIDLNSKPKVSSYPKNMIKTTSRVYFTAFDSSNSLTLYYYDLFSQQIKTILVLKTGIVNPDISSVIGHIGDVIYFQLDKNNNTGNKIWQSDGTDTGTHIWGDFSGNGIVSVVFLESEMFSGESGFVFKNRNIIENKYVFCALSVDDSIKIFEADFAFNTIKKIDNPYFTNVNWIYRDSNLTYISGATQLTGLELYFYNSSLNYRPVERKRIMLRPNPCVNKLTVDADGELFIYNSMGVNLQ